MSTRKDSLVSCKVGPGALSSKGRFVEYPIRFYVYDKIDGRVENKESPVQVWTVKHRYSEFYDLYWSLSSRFPKIEFPPLPGKVYFALLSCSIDSTTESRRKAFERIMTFCLSSDEVCSSAAFKRFTARPTLMSSVRSSNIVKQPDQKLSSEETKAPVSLIGKEPNSKPSVQEAQEIETKTSIAPWKLFVVFIFVVFVCFIRSMNLSEGIVDPQNVSVLVVEDSGINDTQYVIAEDAEIATSEEAISMQDEISKQPEESFYEEARTTENVDVSLVEPANDDEYKPSVVYYLVFGVLCFIGIRSFDREKEVVKKPSESSKDTAATKNDKTQARMEVVLMEETVLDELAPPETIIKPVANTDSSCLNDEAEEAQSVVVKSNNFVEVSKPKKSHRRALLFMIMVLVLSLRANGAARLAALVSKLR